MRDDGYSAASGDTLLWCLGKDNAGHRVLKVTNHRGHPLFASHRGMDVIENAVDWAQWSSLSRIAAGDKATIAPGGTVAFSADLAPGTSAAITTHGVASHSGGSKSPVVAQPGSPGFWADIAWVGGRQGV